MANQLIDEHKKVKGRLRLIWRLGPLFILVLLVLNIYGMVDRVRDFDSEEFALELENEARAAWPSLEYRLSEVAEKLAPKLEKTILDESEKLGEKLESQISDELDRFRKEGESILAEEVQKSLASEKARHHQLVAKHLPTLKDDEKARERVIAHVNAAAAAWSMEQFRKLFSEHVVALEQIRKTLDKEFVVAGETNPAGRADELVLIWLELFEVTVADDSTILGPEKNATGGK